jgi:hypothetical protein
MRAREGGWWVVGMFMFELRRSASFHQSSPDGCKGAAMTTVAVSCLRKLFYFYFYFYFQNPQRDDQISSNENYWTVIANSCLL